jgi:hypothetical protein
MAWCVAGGARHRSAGGDCPSTVVADVAMLNHEIALSIVADADFKALTTCPAVCWLC